MSSKSPQSSSHAQQNSYEALEEQFEDSDYQTTLQRLQEIEQEQIKKSIEKMIEPKKNPQKAKTITRILKTEPQRIHYDVIYPPGATSRDAKEKNEIRVRKRMKYWPQLNEQRPKKMKVKPSVMDSIEPINPLHNNNHNSYPKHNYLYKTPRNVKHFKTKYRHRLGNSSNINRILEDVEKFKRMKKNQPKVPIFEPGFQEEDIKFEDCADDEFDLAQGNQNRELKLQKGNQGVKLPRINRNGGRGVVESSYDSIWENKDGALLKRKYNTPRLTDLAQNTPSNKHPKTVNYDSLNFKYLKTETTSPVLYSQRFTKSVNTHIPYEYTQSELSKILKPLKLKLKNTPRNTHPKTTRSREPTIQFDQEGYLKSDRKYEKLSGKIRLLQKIKLQPRNKSLDPETVKYINKFSTRKQDQKTSHSLSKDQLFRIKQSLKSPPLLKSDDFVGLIGVYSGQYQTRKQHKYSKNFGLEKSLVLSLQRRFYHKNSKRIHSINKMLKDGVKKYPYLNYAISPSSSKDQETDSALSFRERHLDMGKRGYYLSNRDTGRMNSDSQDGERGRFNTLA